MDASKGFHYSWKDPLWKCNDPEVCPVKWNSGWNGYRNLERYGIYLEHGNENL